MTHQYLTLMKSCRTELVFPRCILLSLADASLSIFGYCSPEQSHCLEVGHSTTDCSGKPAEDDLHNEVTTKPLCKSSPQPPPSALLSRNISLKARKSVNVGSMSNMSSATSSLWCYKVVVKAAMLYPRIRSSCSSSIYFSIKEIYSLKIGM